MARIPSGESDEALMARVAQGQDEAFEVLLARYERAIVTFCSAFLRDRGYGEDTAQETFLRVYRHAARYRPETRFTTWLYKIALNLCINEQKKRKIRRTRSLDEPAGSNPDGTKIVERVAGPTPAPLTEAERHEFNRILWEAIAALPDEQRTTLVLLEVHGLSYREIAEVLDVSVSAVKMRVKRARESMQDCLRLLGVEPPKGGT